jgi:AraC-like DNA-binding protein
MRARTSVFDTLRGYQDRVCATYFPLNFHPDRHAISRPFFAQFTTDELGPLEMTEAVVRAKIEGRRSAEDAERRGPDHFVLNIVTAGLVRQAQYNRSSETPANFMSLLHSRGPLETAQLSSTSAIYIRIPGDALRASLNKPEDHCSIAYDMRSGMGALLAEYIRSTWRERTRLDVKERSDLSSNFIGLLTSFLRSRDGATNLSSVDVNMRKAFDFIDQNIGDPNLSPSMIAHATGISVGYLQELARINGTTIGRTIMEKRLVCCHAALTDKSRRARIIEIAFDHGFNDAAHFSRAFKNRFGLSPREVRNAKLLS